MSCSNCFFGNGRPEACDPECENYVAPQECVYDGDRVAGLIGRCLTHGAVMKFGAPKCLVLHPHSNVRSMFAKARTHVKPSFDPPRLRTTLVAFVPLTASDAPPFGVSVQLRAFFPGRARFERLNVLADCAAFYRITSFRVGQVELVACEDDEVPAFVFQNYQGTMSAPILEAGADIVVTAVARPVRGPRLSWHPHSWVSFARFWTSPRCWRLVRTKEPPPLRLSAVGSVLDTRPELAS